MSDLKKNTSPMPRDVQIIRETRYFRRCFGVKAGCLQVRYKVGNGEYYVNYPFGLLNGLDVYAYVTEVLRRLPIKDNIKVLDTLSIEDGRRITIHKYSRKYF